MPRASWEASWLQAINLLWTTAGAVLLCAGAYKFLSAPVTEMSFKLFIPSGVVFAIYFLFQAFQTLVQTLVAYDFATVLSLLLLALSLFVFFLGVVESNADRRAGLFTFAGTVFGLGSGIPFGRLARRPSDKSGQNSSAS